MKKRTAQVLLLLLASLAALILTYNEAAAMPYFARHIGRDCSFCHIAFPKLNETGRIYRSNGFRFAEEEEWPDPLNLELIPVAAEVEIEGVFNRIKEKGSKDESSTLKIEEVELMAAGAFGATGRFSFFAAIGLEQTKDASGSTHFESFNGPLYFRINDLLGPRGEGLLNIKAGKWEVALPFLADHKSFIHNDYLAQKSLGVFIHEDKAIELNGSVVTDDEESFQPTHRYYVGVSREEVNDENEQRNFYAAYTLTFKEVYNIGVIFRNGREADGGDDIRANKYGLAAEAEIESFVLTTAWFRSDRNGGGSGGASPGDLDNFLFEVLYLPMEKVTLGARYDVVKEKSLDAATALSFSARYNFTSKIYTQFEVRTLDDDDHVVGSSEREHKLRWFLVALF